MEFLTDQSSAYINKVTGEIVAATHDEWRMIEDEDLDVDDLPKWQQPLIERMRAVEQSNDFVALPSKFLIHEWQIMHDFCLSVAPDCLRNELYDGIQRRFPDLQGYDSASQAGECMT